MGVHVLCDKQNDAPIRQGALTLTQKDKGFE